RSDTSFTILSDSLHRDLISLNPAAARIWDLCDGSHSVDAMISRMTVEYDVSPRVCATDVMRALTAFKRKGLVSC
ncbi:MAG: PqqD family protein, partial [Syntrophales bacterium]